MAIIDFMGYFARKYFVNFENINIFQKNYSSRFVMEYDTISNSRYPRERGALNIFENISNPITNKRLLLVIKQLMISYILKILERYFVNIL